MALTMGPPIYVRYGRVKIGDEIGEILNAGAVALLIGERPGLGQSESLSAYLVPKPTVAGTVESDRICISNIHQNGTPPLEAAASIIEAIQDMLSNAG
jgi:ethanolamine ammonia-lyase small subunit